MTTAADAQPMLIALLDPSNRADPYPLLTRFREAGPLSLPETHLTVFSSFSDCDDVLRHPSAVSDAMKSTVVQHRIAAGEAVRPPGPPGFLFLDPPDHTRLRRLVSKAFAPRIVKSLEPDIVEMVEGMLDVVEAKGSFEVIGDFAYPLPVAVICRLLGVPLEDEPQFSSASAVLAQALDPFTTITGDTPENIDERQRAGTWLRSYLHGLVDTRRGDPRDDLISALIAAEEAGDQLTEDEIVATCNLLLIAGHETTVNLIGNAMLAMLRDPGQWAALAADPERVSAVVEETMRYDPPVQLVVRIAGEDMTIGAGGQERSDGGMWSGGQERSDGGMWSGGQERSDGGMNPVDVPKGDSMMLLLGAAHRDQAAHDRPDEFDPDRSVIRHLGFGKGPHFCLGAPLARLEASVALAAAARRFPDARLAGEPVYKPNVTLRGYSSLAVTV